MHNPHKRTNRGGRIETTNDNEISVLNINQSVTCVSAGQLKTDHDVLVVGTQTNLLAYDVEANSDLFYKDVIKLFIFLL